MAYNDWWTDLCPEINRIFPGVSAEDVLDARGDIAVMIRLVSEAHDLTLKEASEMVSMRLVPLLTRPRYSAPEPLREAG